MAATLTMPVTVYTSNFAACLYATRSMISFCYPVCRTCWLLPV